MNPRFVLGGTAFAAALLDVSLLLTASGVWVDSRPLRMLATLPFAISHALFGVWYCADFETSDQAFWKGLFLGFPLLAVSAIPYGWLALGSDAATASVSYGLGAVAGAILIGSFLLISAAVACVVGWWLSRVLQLLSRSLSEMEENAHVALAAVLFGGWCAASCAVLMLNQSSAELRLSGSNLGTGPLFAWCGALVLSSLGLVWSLVAMVLRRAR